MKKKLLIIFAFFLLPSIAFASDDGVYVHYNLDSQKVVFSGYDNSNTGLPVSLFAYQNPDVYKIAKLIPSIDKYIDFKSYMPESTISGEYTAEIITPSNNFKRKFPYIRIPQDDLTKLANSALNTKNLDEFVSLFFAKVGIDNSYYTNNSININKFFIAFAPKIFDDNLKVIRTYYSAETMTKILGSNQLQIVDLLSSTRNFTSIDFDEFLKLNENFQKSVALKLSLGKIHTNSFYSTFAQAKFLATVEYGDKWSEIKKLFLESYNNDLYIDLTQYNNLKYPDKVFIALLGRSFSNIEEFGIEFIKQVKLQANLENTSLESDKINSTRKVNPSLSFKAEEQIKEPISNDTFSDIDNKHWAYKYVIELRKKGIINGDGNGRFRPDEPITRAEFIKIVVQIFCKDVEPVANTFSDIEKGSWYENYVLKAMANGILTGKGNGIVSPHENITRQDMSVVLCKVIDKPIHKRDFEKFYDYYRISDYAKKSVETLFCAEIITGRDNGFFEPMGMLTRAETAAVVYLIEDADRRVQK